MHHKHQSAQICNVMAQLGAVDELSVIVHYNRSSPYDFTHHLCRTHIRIATYVIPCSPLRHSPFKLLLLLTGDSSAYHSTDGHDTATCFGDAGYYYRRCSAGEMHIGLIYLRQEI